MKKIFLIFCVLIAPYYCSGKVSNLTPELAIDKVHEILKTHATHKEITQELAQRSLQNFIDILDPTKSYFIESDINHWLNASPELLQRVLNDLTEKRFSVFEEIHESMVLAINRRKQLEQQINLSELPEHVNPKEFKDMKWVASEEELLSRLFRIKALQVETAVKLNDELKEISIQRIAKRQSKKEDEFTNKDPIHHTKLILSYTLKAIASSLDAHTAYFTPDEAAQFLISVQQRLFGIGAQLRDDLNGFTIVKIVEGGPAAIGSKLKVKDRIIAVDGEPVVGMDIIDAVELIRGKENTWVTLTVIRQEENETYSNEDKLEIPVKRGEVVLKETRYESNYEPFGDGVIGYLRLYTFYQDPEHSSTIDLDREIQKLKKDHNLKGIILDLRYNSGGLLTQAVGVSGLFITKGIVVSIKDNTDAIQHLRDIDGKISWDGPLIVLVNRASASASEIVAQTLQDYGRAIIVGDDHTYGKGTFQTFSLNATNEEDVNQSGEYKVTRGKYYTVSGKTPQQTGVMSNVVVSGALSESEIGEKYAKYPLENDTIKENFEDDLSDIPYWQREKIRLLYKYDLQPKIKKYSNHIDTLIKNSKYRIEQNKGFQSFLKNLRNKDASDDETEEIGDNDYQLLESYNVMKDLIILSQSQKN